MSELNGETVAGVVDNGAVGLDVAGARLGHSHVASLPRARELKGKICLVTGGSRGIGRATALALAEAGADVVFNFQNSGEQALEVSWALQDMGIRCRAFQADVTSEEEVLSMVDEVVKEFGPISIVVNNAGIARDKSFRKMTKSMWDEVLRVHLDGMFNVTQAVLPAMIDSGWGRVINVSSVVGQTGNFGQANYAAAKGGIISFTRTLARELASKGITVNAVAPGFIATDMLQGLSKDHLREIKAQTPVGRLGRAEEVADAIAFLASPRAAYITGQVLGINGGMYM